MHWKVIRGHFLKPTPPPRGPASCHPGALPCFGQPVGPHQREWGCWAPSCGCIRQGHCSSEAVPFRDAEKSLRQTRFGRPQRNGPLGRTVGSAYKSGQPRSETEIQKQRRASGEEETRAKRWEGLAARWEERRPGRARGSRGSCPGHPGHPRSPAHATSAARPQSLLRCKGGGVRGVRARLL